MQSKLTLFYLDLDLASIVQIIKSFYVCVLWFVFGNGGFYLIINSVIKEMPNVGYGKPVNPYGDMTCVSGNFEQGFIFTSSL